MTSAYDSNSYSKDSNSSKDVQREYNTTNELNQMFAQFTPIRKRRVHSAWSSFFYDKNSLLAGSNEGSNWMSSLQQTFHANASNPYYSNGLDNYNNRYDSNNDDKRLKKNYKRKSRRIANYRAIQGEQTAPQ